MEHTTKSELPNEYMEEIRSRVAWDLAELRRVTIRTTIEGLQLYPSV